MPWVAGIDEAGYGPNLGPLVQAAIALKLPHGDTAGWNTLRSVVRRAREKADRRMLIDDSKQVYSRGGLEALERGVWTFIAPEACPLCELLWSGGEVPEWGEELCREAWFDRGELLPLQIDPLFAWEQSEPFRAAVEERWTGDFRIVPPSRFNRVVEEYGSKAVVLSRGLIELIESITAAVPDDGDAIHFMCDKQGGRNYYAAIVQEAFPDGWVVVERESAAESRYRVENLTREMTITFRPRADGESIAVALASMLCKYLREVCMRQFNRFWAEHVPGITPTAGYPLDAKRFYENIRPVMTKLGLSEEQVWRKK